MQTGNAPAGNVAGRVLSQGSVDGFWILLVFGLLFFNPIDAGSSGSKINLSLYDVLLPLIFLFELVRGRIGWPGGKIVLLFFLPALAIGTHSALTGIFLDGVHLTPLLIGTLRQVAFFADVAMLVLLFQLPERRRPSSGVFLALLFMAGAYALMMRYMEARYADWAIYETIYAAMIAGLMLIFLFLQSSAKKPVDSLKPIAAIAWTIAVMVLLYTKFFILIAFLVAVLFFFSESLKSDGGRLGRLIGLIAFSAALVALFIIVLIEMNMGIPFAGVYGNLLPGIWHSVDIRMHIWSLAWQQAVESFPWGLGLNQFGGDIVETPGLKMQRLTSVHNTPLRLLMELGVLGIAVFGVVLAFVGLAGKKLNAAWKGIFCLYIMMPMLLHDALGLRVFHVVLAFFLAGTFFKLAQGGVKSGVTFKMRGRLR